MVSPYQNRSSEVASAASRPIIKCACFARARRGLLYVIIPDDCGLRASAAASFAMSHVAPMIQTSRLETHIFAFKISRPIVGAPREIIHVMFRLSFQKSWSIFLRRKLGSKPFRRVLAGSAAILPCHSARYEARLFAVVICHSGGCCVWRLIASVSHKFRLPWFRRRSRRHFRYRNSIGGCAFAGGTAQYGRWLFRQ